MGLHRRRNAMNRPSSLWRERTFRYVWCGQTASIVGDRVTGLALPWLILLQTRSASAAGLVLAARYLPLMLLGLPAGVLADRVDRRALMIACDIARAAALGAVALLGALRQTPPLWLLTMVVLVLGAGQLGFGVAYRAWLPDITGGRLLGQANAALEASDAASTLVGPALGGALIGVIGPVLALGADAVSYVVSAVTLLSTRVRTGGASGDYTKSHPCQPAFVQSAPTSPSEDSRSLDGRGIHLVDDTASHWESGRPVRFRRNRVGQCPQPSWKTNQAGGPPALPVDPRIDGHSRAVGSGLGSWAHALWDDMVVGIHAVVASPARRFLLVAGTVLYLDTGAVELLLAALTQLHLRLPAWQAGLVFGAAGAGGLIASALAPRVYEAGWRRGLAAALAVGALGSVGLALSALFAPAPGFAVALVSNLSM